MKYSDIPLPKAWPRRVKSAFINAVSLAHTAITYSRAWCADSPLKRVQLAGQLDQARQEIAMLKEEIRIKDTRMARIPPHHRPFYPPTERFAIHALRAARGWNLDQIARAFLVEPAIISTWMKRLDKDGEQTLIKLPVPINRFPDFVVHIVQQLKVLCLSFCRFPHLLSLLPLCFLPQQNNFSLRKTRWTITPRSRTAPARQGSSSNVSVLPQLLLASARLLSA